jgi:hypothetical protein
VAGLAMGWPTQGTILSVLENENTTYFCSYCLLPLESIRIINESPIKKTYTWGKKVSGWEGFRSRGCVGLRAPLGLQLG